MLKRIDLGKEAILPLIFKMSWPSIVAMMAMSIYNFIDSFWLARLSSQALAALTVCFPLQMIFAAIGVGTAWAPALFPRACSERAKTWKQDKQPDKYFFFLFFSGWALFCLFYFFMTN